jgi:hypothetical protein
MSPATNKESKFVLQERGYFWWAKEKIPKGRIGPEGAVAGTLSVDDDGMISLELDGVLPGHSPLSSVFSNDETESVKSVRGILKAETKHILLGEVTKNGGQISSGGISYQQLRAQTCLVSTMPFQQGDTPPSVRSIEFELTGFEEWLGPGAITVKRTKRGLTSAYKNSRKLSYDVAAGRMTLRSGLAGPYFGKTRLHEVSLRDDHFLCLEFREPQTLRESIKSYGLLEDFLLVLTGSDFRPPEWPVFTIKGQRNRNQHCTAYFYSLRSSASPPGHHDLWTNFQALKDRFGMLFDQWWSKHRIYGPGFYLLLGNRRGMKLYAEHRFVNLIWGLESLHRRKSPKDLTPRPLGEKVERILSQISPGDDRRWLKSYLKHADEPNLSERLTELLVALPFGIDKSRCDAFTVRCAKVRNDLAHFGGQRETLPNYGTFVRELSLLSEALEFFYEILLLQEIGIDAAHLKWLLDDGFRSYGIKTILVQVELLDPSSLKLRNR